MINTTRKPLLVTPHMNASELDRSIRNALKYAFRNEAINLGFPNAKAVLRNRNKGKTFAGIFEDELRAQHVYTEEFIQAAFEISELTNSAKLSLDDESMSHVPNLLTLILKTRTKLKLQRVLLTELKAAFRPFLVHLWFQGILILPLVFTVERSLKARNLNELLSEVAATFHKHRLSKTALQGSKASIRALYTDLRAIRLVWATNWHSFGEVNLTEASQLHVAALKTVEGSISPNNWWPVVPMLSELLKRYENKVQYTSDDIKVYKLWIRQRTNYLEYSFDDFRTNLQSIKGERTKKQKFKKASYRRRIDRRKRQRPEELKDVDYTKPTFNEVLEKVAAGKNHTAAVDYFTKASGLQRGYAPDTPYPGREHVDIRPLKATWTKTFEGFLGQREQRGLEDNQLALSTLTLLCDYLFLYLPWWAELYGDNDFHLPTSPAEFERFKFLVSTGKSIEDAPLPLFEIVKYRRRTIGTVGAFVSGLSFYFDYLVAYQDRFPELGSRVVTNPVVMKLDYPRGRIKGSNKSNKVPFSKKVFPYLIRYLYAIEEFGMYLQNQVLAGRLRVTKGEQRAELIPEDYGSKLEFSFKGRTHQIRRIPKVFSIAKRTIRNEQGELRCILIPHLTILRIFIVGLETGLRIQSIQWLDRFLWDSLNSNKPLDSYVYELFVNTDKVRERPWASPLVYRARDVLLREQHFQESIEENGMDDKVSYENRPNSRFADLVPLFRSAGPKGKPAGDVRYQMIWSDLLYGFQEFYNEEVSRDTFTQFVELKPKWICRVEAEGNEVVEFAENGDPYCPLRLAPIHTPHAVRVTFISNRSGILAIEDIAEAVGHSNTLVTYHYTIEPFDELAAGIEVADKLLFEYDPDNPVHIRADRENSALRRSFERNPVDTEKRFGFSSISLLNEKTKDLKDGVELLRTTPMTEVVFRETHICPVGEVCPDDVWDLIQEPRRCGLCPLAVKSVDHLPAIAAKMSLLLEQMQNASSVLERMKAKGEPETVLDELNERRKLDSLEYLGWKRALMILSSIQDDDASEDCNALHVDTPDLVKHHLKLVSTPSSKVEFVLSRIADAKVFPSMETPELRANANRLRQQLLANVGRIEEALQEVPVGDELTACLSSMRVVMDALGLTRRGLLDNMLFENKGSARAALNSQKLLASPSEEPRSRGNSLMKKVHSGGE